MCTYVHINRHVVILMHISLLHLLCVGNCETVADSTCLLRLRISLGMSHCLSHCLSVWVEISCCSSISSDTSTDIVCSCKSDVLKMPFVWV